MALRLIIQDEEGATTIVPLGEEEITIGREAGNTIQLTEQNVSRQHARLTQGPDGWVLEDLDSYNGIKVNGVPIEAQITLNEGDLVQIGDYHLSLAENAETALNLDRPVTAANSSGVGEVLPPSSGDEAATDNPFAATATASASAAASPLGSSPLGEALSSPTASPSATSTALDDNEEETTKSGGFGLLLLLLLAVAAGGGYYYFVVLPGQSTGPGSPPRVANAAVDDPADPADPAAPADSAGPGGEGPTDNDKGATKTPAIAGDDGDGQGDPGGDDADADAQGDPGDDDASDGDDDVALTKTPTKKPTTTVPKKKKPPKTETPPPPKADPVELLGDARKASLAGNYSQAYKLAKQSYDIARDKEALKLMGVSACSMGDAAKAKSVYTKADAATKKALASLCANKGVDLE